MRKSVAIALGLLLTGGAVWAQQYLITTVAGNGTAGYKGDGGPATSAQFLPGALAVDGAGNLYIADSSAYVIREVVTATGIITTVAGSGTYGSSGDGGPATSAQLSQPVGLAVDGSGNIYIAEMRSSNGATDGVLREVSAATGIITTVAQIGIPLPHLLPWSYDVAADGSGNIYICKGQGSVILEMVAATGIITTLAGGGSAPPGDGGPATSVYLSRPVGVAVDGSGNIYIPDMLPNTAVLGPPPYDVGVVRKVTAATGLITTVAGNGTYGYSGDGGPATSAQLGSLSGVAVDGSGNLYIADGGNNRIRKVGTDGIITTVAGNGTSGYSGDGGPATNAQLNAGKIAMDAAGDIYVSDGAHGVVRMLVPMATHALLRIVSTHPANFARGQMSASYSVVVSNTAGAGPTSGTVTVTETMPVGLTLVSMSGPGWSCSGNACTRNDALNSGASYPAIAVTVNVAADAPLQFTNQAGVTGGGSLASWATDLTTLPGPPDAPVLTSPTNQANGVVTAPTLTWSASASWNGSAVSYDVYFGRGYWPPLVATVEGTSYAPGTLSPSTTYDWQVVARNSFGSTSSQAWSFTTGPPAIGSRFVPVTPCRVADTRNPAGPFGGPTMTAGSTRVFAIPQSGCGIPSTAMAAQAYSLNVTVVPDGPLSFLTLYQDGHFRPGVSTLNSFDGTVVANAAIVSCDYEGKVAVYVSDQSDVILDIDGYFDATGAANSSSFYVATPCRVADTRGPTGQFGGPSMFPGQGRDFPLPSGSCGIPLGATAYSVNVTAVPQTKFLAYLTTWPTGSPQPLVSTLNSWTGTVVANAAVVPAGSNGSISVFVKDPADVILDIDGYFGQPGNPGALAFYPVDPCRLVDTRSAAGPFGGPEMEAATTRSFAIPAGGCSIPSTAVAYSVNVTVVPDGLLSYLTAWPTGSPQPFVSTLNSWDGAVVANAAIIPAGTDGAISVYVTQPTHVILDINGYFAP